MRISSRRGLFFLEIKKKEMWPHYIAVRTI